VTLVLTASNIGSLLDDLGPVLGAVRAGFLADTSLDDIVTLRVHTPLPAEGSATALLPGLLPGVPAYSAKINAKFPRAQPALRGVVCLHDLEDGELLALLDSGAVTAWRTGVAAALLTHQLSQAGATTLGVIGAGAQARIVVRALAYLRGLTSVIVNDIDESAARELLRLAAQLGIVGEVAESPHVVAKRAAIIVMATWSRIPLLALEHVRPGHHITTLGADEPGKRELAGDVLAQALLVVDDRELVQAAGATASAGLAAEAIDATATEVLDGKHPGRTGDEQLTAYAPIGLPWQDLALSWHLFQAAIEQDQGVTIDLLD
jgi:ornithine cyclodeaminase